MTRADLEARRLMSIPYFQDGTRKVAIARTFGVSRTTVSRWGKLLMSRGETSLKSRKATGRPSRMTANQQALLKAIFRDGPEPSGMTGRWTQKKFSIVITRVTGIEYSEDHVGRIMHGLGLKPRRKART